MTGRFNITLMCCN